MAYINDLPTQIPFYTNSSDGVVNFTKSVGKDNFNNVSLTISKDIHLLGRTGAYWYNNSDHSIRMSIEMCNFLEKKSKKDFNFREYF